MKKLVVLFVLLLTLACCTTEADRTRMRAGLDSINQRNRNDQPFTVQDVEPYVQFFDRHGTPNDRLLAHYLLGRAYHEQNDMPLALRNYYDAINQVDTTSSKCDFNQLSRVYGQIAELYHQQHAPRLEILAERKAIEYAWRAKDTLTAILFYSYLDGPYHMLNLMDSALFYNQEAIKLLKHYGYPELAAGLLPMSIDIYLRKNDYLKAKSAMDEFEYYSDEYANHGEDLSYLGQYYGYKGTYYKGIEKLDSAEYYYRILLSRSHNIDNLSMASMGLLSLYQKLGYSDSIAKYAVLYCQTNDSANLAHSSEEVVRTQALYNYQEHERIAVLKDKEALYYRRIVISLIIAVLLSTYSIYIYIKRQKLRTRKELMKANSAYNSLLSQYNQAKSDLDLTQEGLDEYQKEKEAEIQKLKMGLALYLENPSQLDAWDMEQAMLHSPIVKKLHELACQVKPPSQIQWHDFRQFAEEYLPDFFNKVNDKEKRLTYQEVLICLLVRLHFIPTELAALLGVSKQRITNLRGHINYVLFNERSSKTLNDNILAL